MDPNYGTRNKSNYVFLTCIEINPYSTLPSPSTLDSYANTYRSRDWRTLQSRQQIFVSVELLKRDQTYHNLEVYVNYI